MPRTTRPMTVRLLADHARSPIWFGYDAVLLEMTGLGGGLISDLTEWAQQVERLAHVDADDADLAGTVGLLSDEGVRLARRIALELGDEFEVEFGTAGVRGRFRSDGIAGNRRAADAFRAIAAGRTPDLGDPADADRRNWAGNLVYRAAHVVHPATIDELQQILAAGGPVRVLGTRHSFNDLADTEGTLIATDRLPVHVDTSSGRAGVRLSGGLRYGDLAPRLQERGLALANLASLPHISIPGAIATGTHGSGDRIGTLAAAVRWIAFLTPDGGHRLLQRGDDDFAGAVVHLGALGVVTALELELESTYDVAQTVYEQPRWDAILAELDSVTALGTSVSIFTTWARTDVAAQLWVKQRLPIETDAAASAELIARLGARAASGPRHPIPGIAADACTPQLGEPGPWLERLPHFRLEFTPSAGEELQSEYLVPRAVAVAALEAVRSLAHRIAPLLLTSEVRTVRADDLWLSPAYGADVVGIHFTWRRDEAAVRALLPVLEAALPEAARPHWGKVFTLSGDELRRRYPRWDDFVALRERHDPDGRFRNAFLRRLGF